MSDTSTSRRNFLGRAVTVAAATAVRPARILAANDRLGIGIIGCGRRNLLKEVLDQAAAANVEVRAVCDTWRQAREAAVEVVRNASGTGPAQHVHYRELLSSKDIDGVVIGSPDHQHCRMLAAACAAGKDVYVEKPLAMNMEELDRAASAVRAHRRVVQMGTQIRSYANVAAARAFVAAGGLGHILKVEQSRNAYRPYWHAYGERKVDEADVDWRGFLMHVPYRPFDADQYAAWYGYREFSRGPHSALMVHFIDLVHFITGARMPRRAVTLGGIYRWKDRRTVPDSVETILEYPDEGFLVRYNTTFGTGAGNYMKFLGTRGVLDTSRWNQPFTVSGEGSGEPDRIASEARALPEEPATPHMKNWLDCIRSRKEPIAPIDAGYAHSVAVILADEAYVRGVRMAYDPAKRAIRPG